MKETNMSRCKKMALLALASIAMLAPSSRGAVLAPDLNHLILGFRADANPGQTANLEVDLGLVDQFYGSPGSTIALPGMATADLVGIYGVNWITRSDLHWGVVGTAGRANGYTNGPVAVAVATLWATVPNCDTPFNRGSTAAQKNASSKIEPMIVAGAPGTLLGATSTANSSTAANISTAASGSWSAQDLISSGLSFGFFNPTIDNFEGQATVMSQLFEIQPGSGAATFLGDFILTSSGLSFRRASPLAALCKTGVILQAANSNCLATATVADINNGSTGYCVDLSIDANDYLPVGATNITLTAVDGFGSNATCTASVTVEAGAPTITCPADFSVNTVGALCNKVVTYTTPTPVGCAAPINVVCTPPSGSTFNVGDTTVNCVATDSQAPPKVGNCSFKITVVSTAAPTITCSPSIIQTALVGQCTAIATWATPATTGCNPPIGVVCTPASGSTFALGLTAVNCVATDAANRTANCGFNVTVVSVDPPGITCPTSIIQTALVGQCTSVVSWAAPATTGCNTPIGVVCTPASGSTFALGLTAVNCVATDAAGRTGNCGFNVTVVSTAPPTINCVASIVTNVPTAVATSIDLNYTLPTTGGCNTPIGIVCTPPPGSTFNIGTTPVNCVATDAAGRIANCGFNVTVNGAGIDGIKQQVNALTDPKLTTGRRNSLLGYLTRAKAAFDHLPNPKTGIGCGQLKGFIIAVRVYGNVGIITPAEAASLTAAAQVSQAVNGCH